MSTFEKKPEDEAWSLKGIAFRKQGMDPKGKVVALFSGQGSQYLNMGRELFLNFPPLLDPYGQINTRFQDSGQTPISQIVFPPPAFDDDTKQAFMDLYGKVDAEMHDLESGDESPVVADPNNKCPF